MHCQGVASTRNETAVAVTLSWMKLADEMYPEDEMRKEIRCAS
jgi:hypothetical protein